MQLASQAYPQDVDNYDLDSECGRPFQATNRLAQLMKVS